MKSNLLHEFSYLGWVGSFPRQSNNLRTIHTYMGLVFFVQAVHLEESNTEHFRMWFWICVPESLTSLKMPINTTM